MIAALPLLALPVLVYNLIVLPAGPDGLEIGLFTVHMASGADWRVTVGDLLLAASLVVLFAELLKSANSRRAAIVNHGLSMLLFIACLVELLLHPAFATSVFFLITLMVLLDVLAGFIVTILAARRDVDFGAGVGL
ncbi:MAG: hypothetical protein WCY15_05405 [Phenylobacterium sp.]|jgi:hypothetical protein|uniref:hypothetical protein n=1 Tax=Phenylobacterium sp. TaxID=1871053 RepID=UPI002A2E7CA6|nr:hypothetical protein [Phenylobacterium sp.]MDD3837068.1 hypothetical protein [Phenylobacterium sp.]MDX9997195.1 hypothetical protein [Phenylobacterium sp.]